ncbi:hypothetical protein [Streptosporangium carneum]|uniref:Lipoprotein n=1 Tax=Streptosporangium carneum TaxID=47481 RepID=A0A9W6I8F3_9ACTN|nr:hypothetical protein [Streptosporangium carneum]GLK14011.1 hypothetical protein GCM10017600_74230 [Streptosporangium carneum]
MKRFAIALTVAALLLSAACGTGTPPPAPGATPRTAPAGAERLTVDDWSADSARAEFRGTVREPAHYEQIYALRKAPPGDPYPWEVSPNAATIVGSAWTLHWDVGAAAPGTKWVVVLASLPIASCEPGYRCDPLDVLRRDGPAGEGVKAAVTLN